MVWRALFVVVFQLTILQEIADKDRKHIVGTLLLIVLSVVLKILSDSELYRWMEQRRGHQSKNKEAKKGAEIIEGNKA